MWLNPVPVAFVPLLADLRPLDMGQHPLAVALVLLMHVDLQALEMGQNLVAVALVLLELYPALELNSVAELNPVAAVQRLASPELVQSGASFFRLAWETCKLGGSGRT